MVTYIQSYRGVVDSLAIGEPTSVPHTASLRGTVNTTITQPGTAPTRGPSGRGVVTAVIGSKKDYIFWDVVAGALVPLQINSSKTRKDFEFTPGSVKPGPGNVGAGVIRAWPTQVITTITGSVDSDGWVRDKVIAANLTPVTAIEGFENCLFIGPETWSGNGWLLGGNSSSAAHPIRAYFCTFDPQTPSAYANCIGPKYVEAYYCEMKNTTDCISAFNDAPGSGPCLIKVVATWAHSMVRWAPDYATNNRPDTHNDIIQLQGSNATTDDDVLLDGVFFDGRHSTTLGNPPSPGSPGNISCIMMNYGVYPRACLTIRRSWLSGGVATVNGGDDKVSTTTGSKLTMSDTILEVRNGSVPQYSLLLDVNLPRSITNVTYPDGTPAWLTNG